MSRKKSYKALMNICIDDYHLDIKDYGKKQAKKDLVNKLTDIYILRTKEIATKCKMK